MNACQSCYNIQPDLSLLSNKCILRKAWRSNKLPWREPDVLAYMFGHTPDESWQYFQHRSHSILPLLWIWAQCHWWILTMISWSHECVLGSRILQTLFGKNITVWGSSIWNKESKVNTVKYSIVCYLTILNGMVLSYYWIDTQKTIPKIGRLTHCKNTISVYSQPKRQYGNSIKSDQTVKKKLLTRCVHVRKIRPDILGQDHVDI